MITYETLEKIYLKKISLKFKRLLGNKILEDYPQRILNKALRYKLTQKDSRELFLRGNQKAKEYPGLNYIAKIYIHELTKYQGLLINLNKLERAAEREMQKQQEEKLSFSRLIKLEINQKSFKDRRRTVDRAIVEYTDNKKNIYRKSFEYLPGKYHLKLIPSMGTHSELNNQKYKNLNRRAASWK